MKDTEEKINKNYTKLVNNIEATFSIGIGILISIIIYVIWKMFF